MEFKDIAKSVANYAPLLGAALGGPAGSAIGALIAAKFGTVNSAESVLKAIATDPASAIKLAEIESTERTRIVEIDTQARIAELQSDNQVVTQVNETMRVEAAQDKWWVSGWRPAIGFATAISFTFISALFCFLAYKAIILQQPEALKQLPDLLSAFSLLFATPAGILGVASYWRGKEKIERFVSNKQH